MKGHSAFNSKLHKWIGQQKFTGRSTMTVFCDFDGPIVNVAQRYYSTYCEGLKRIQAIARVHGDDLDIAMLSQAQFWQMKRDRIADEDIARMSGICGEYIPLFLQEVKQIVNQPQLLSQDTMQPGVRSALSLLRSRGFDVVLVTLRHQRQVKQILHNSGLANYFTDIYGTRDRHAAYQNYAQLKTDLLRSAVAKYRQPYGVPGWMIGDTEADILAGQALELPTIALTCGIRSAEYLRQFQPDTIKTDLLSAVYSIMGCTESICA